MTKHRIAAIVALAITMSSAAHSRQGEEQANASQPEAVNMRLV